MGCSVFTAECQEHHRKEVQVAQVPHHEILAGHRISMYKNTGDKPNHILEPVVVDSVTQLGFAYGYLSIPEGKTAHFMI